MKKLAKLVCIAVCALNGMAVCSLGVFAQQSEKIKVVEPYASVSFGTGRAEVAQTNLPSVAFGLGNRYSSISTKTGLSLEADYAIDWGMLRETGDNSCFSTSFKLSVGIGYNYIFNTEDVFSMLSLSVGIGGEYGGYYFKIPSNGNTNLSSYDVIAQMSGCVPIRLRWILDDVSLAFTYRPTITNTTSANSGKRIDVLPFEISAGVPLDMKKVNKAVLGR